MVLNPTSQEEIEESVESRLKGRIAKLTNFVATSFNRVFLDAFAAELYDYEVRLLAAQLSGWVDYAGGPITQSDLDSLGISNFDSLELLNSYMDDSDLDNIGSLVGVERNDGEPATGEVEVGVFDQNTRVPDGMLVSTAPDFDGTTYVFEVDLGDDDFVRPIDQGNVDTVTVSVESTENGSEYNVGSNTITRFRSPPPGVESVTNPTATSGGDDVETNDELRDRIKSSVFSTSGGGTVAGIEGFVSSTVDGVNDVFVDEFKDSTPVFVDVIVDGGVESDVLDAIETSRPAGIRHNLVRPVTYNLAVDMEVRGTDVDKLKIKDGVESYLFGLDLGEDYIRDRVIQIILNSDSKVENVLTLNTRVVEVVNDTIQYNSGTSQYDLADSPLGFIEDEKHYYTSDETVYPLNVDPVDGSDVTVEAIVDGSPDTVLTGGGTDYTVIDDNGDGMLDAIDFSGGSTLPDSGTVIEVDYGTVTESTETFTYDGSAQYTLGFYPALAEDSSVADNSGDTYTLGTDYDIIDVDGDGEKETIEWLDGGSTPDEPEDFTVTYEINRGSIESVSGTIGGEEEQLFEEGVDFNELDGTGDGYTDQIDWSVGGTNPDDQTLFSVDASIEKTIQEDYFVDNRSKISPVVDEITISTYQ